MNSNRHYDAAGLAGHRQGGFVLSDWDELRYLKAQLDVATAVAVGRFDSSYHHYLPPVGEKAQRFPPGRTPEK